MASDGNDGRRGGFRVPRWILLVLGVIAVLVIAGFVALKVIFPPEKLRAMVVPRVEAAVGREVEIGRVGLDVFPGLAVRVEDLSIANAPGFGPEPALRLDALDLKLRILPLLRRELEFREIQLVRPRIRYEVSEDGTTNLAGLGGAKRGGDAAAGAGGGAALGLIVSDLSLRDGELVYVDRGAGRGARLSVDGRVSAVPGPAEGTLESRGTVELGSIRALAPALGADTVGLPDLRAEYEVTAAPPDSVGVRRLELELGGVPLSGTGALYALDTERRLRLGLESGAIDLGDLLASLPDVAATRRLVDLDADGEARVDVRAEGSLADAAGPSVSGTLRLREVSAAYGAMGQLVTRTAGRIEFTRTSASLREVEGQLLGRPYTLEATITGFDDPRVEGDLDAELDLGRVAGLRPEMLGGASLTGRAALDVRFSGPVREPTGLSLTGPIELTDVTYERPGLDTPVRVPSGTIRLAGADGAVEDLQVRLGDSRVTVSARAPGAVARVLDPAAAAEPLTLDGDVQGSLQLEGLAALRPDTAPALPVRGRAAIDLRFAGPIEPRERMRLTGPIRLSGVSYRSERLTAPVTVASGTIRLTGTGVRIENLPLRAGDSDLTLSLTGTELLPYVLSGGATAAPTVELTARSERLNWGELSAGTDEELGYSQLVTARLAGRAIDGRDPGEIARERYALPPLPPIEATGRVTVGEFLNPPTEARNVSFRLVARGGEIRLNDLEVGIYGGRASGSATLDLRSGAAPFPFRYDLSLAGGDAGTFLTRWTRLGQALTGQIDFSIEGTTRLDEALLPMTDATDARGRTTVRSGQFREFGPARALMSRFNLDPGRRSAFRQLGGGFEIRGGAFVLDAWDLTMGDLAARIGGSAGLGGSLDLTVGLDVPLSTLQEAGLVRGGRVLGDILNRLAGEDQSIELELGIGGTMTSPAVQLDEDALQEAIRRQLQGTGDDLLKRLFKPPPR